MAQTEGNRSSRAGERAPPKTYPGCLESTESKAVPREVRQEGGSVKAGRSEGESEAARVPERAKQAASERACERAWIDRNIWTDRMLAALDNGVKGDKWFSLIDKVYRAQTLAGAWQQVKSNRGAAGIDGQSIERFGAQAGRYLEELGQELKEGRYRPSPVKKGGDSQSGRQDAPAGDSHGQRPNSPDGSQAGDRTDLREDVPAHELRIPTG